MKEVENIVANLEQFLLLPECFQKSAAAEASESVNMRETIIEPYQPYLPFYRKPVFIKQL